MNVDNLDRARFPWPEPLVIEVICENYDGLLPQERKLTLAKLHEKLLREKIEDSAPYGSKLRGDFLAHCAALGLTREIIARVDEAVFFELIRLVGSRFRHSARLRDGYAAQLEACLSEASAVQTTETPAVTRPPRSLMQRWKPATFATA